MPFTFSHPAAAVPLYRPLGRFGVLSALVIGSTVPDVIYFVPLGVTARLTHGLPGLITFCLPVGMVLYLLFHLLLKKPGLDLMPRWARARLAPHAAQAAQAAWPAAGTSPWGVPVSLVLGAATHIVWDAFTHAGAFGVRLFPVLNTLLFEAHGYRLYLFKLLQHLSSVLGLALLAWWGWRWFSRLPVPAQAPAGLLSERVRWGLWALLVVAPLVAAFWRTLVVWRHAILTKAEALLVHFVVLDIMLVGGLVLLYSLVWQILAWRKPPR